MDAEQPDPALDVVQSLRVSKLRQAELQEMDRVLLAQANDSWKKVAHVVDMAIGILGKRLTDIPDVYYAQRVQNLVALGKLESRGNLAHRHQSDVRLPRK
ncbi:MAG: DUF3658 domain-containing protein [Pseudomonadota bacterium]